MSRLLIASLLAATSLIASAQNAPVFPGFNPPGSGYPSGPPVLNHPYTGTATTTTVQILPDGTTTTQTTTMWQARDSSGRTLYLVPGQSSSDPTVPAATEAMLLDPASNTMTSWTIPVSAPAAPVPPAAAVADPDASSAPAAPATPSPSLSDANQALVVHLPTPATTSTSSAPSAPGPASPGGSASAPAAVPGPSQSVDGSDDGDSSAPPPPPAPQMLGFRTVAGIPAVGSRITTPVSAEPGSTPAFVTQESWTSPDLQIQVLEIDTDPRSGSNSVALTNVQRTEPDPALFTIPPTYTVTEVDTLAANTPDAQ